MKNKKKQVSLTKIVIICFIILIPVVAGTFSLYKHYSKQNNASQGGAYSTKDNSLVTYNQNDVNKLQELKQNRQKLSYDDAMVKVNLIKKANPLAQTDDYKITYDPTSDTFQAEITTISIDNAKSEVVAWFTSQGMSPYALCELPVSFTLEDSIAQSLKGLDVVFSPLTPGC